MYYIKKYIFYASNVIKLYILSVKKAFPTVPSEQFK